MIKPFVYFINQNLVRKSAPNISMARSLLEKAETRLKRISKERIKEEESSIVFEDIYESLREASQSLMELKGYKPYSHEALISFLKENNLLPEEKVNVIDNYRVLRNNSVYKAEKVSLDKCTEALDFAKNTIPMIRNKFGDLRGIEEKDSLWSKGYFAETMGKGDIEKKMRTFHMKHDEEMNYNCKKCNVKISAHNRDWHDGMCDECFNEQYFPEDAKVFETNIERIRIHCRSNPVKKENHGFKEFLQSTDFEQERIMKIINEIRAKVKCPNDESCCSIINKGLQKKDLDRFFANAELCPIVFNVLENAKEEFLEDIYAFENPDI